MPNLFLLLNQRSCPSIVTEPWSAEGSLWVQLVQPFAESEETLAILDHARQETCKNDGWEVLPPFAGDIC